MNNTELSFGQALAYLKVIDCNEELTSEGLLPESARDYIKELCRCKNELNDDGLIKKLFTKIPECTCQSEHPYLHDNKEFFIALLIIKSGHYCCEQLTRHLNNCFNCFDVFCQVLRDYFHTSNDLIMKTQV
jgi:hypothetical protein